ncbi:MAG: hypothetical protein JJW01_03685 [Alphaproteobacteria bacterium]|nr:hypothetical protein [Rickettsiales bacterium]
MNLLFSFVKKIDERSFVKTFAFSFASKLMILLFLVFLFSSKKMELRFNNMVANLFDPILYPASVPIEATVRHFASYKEYTQNIANVNNALGKIYKLEAKIAYQEKKINDLTSIQHLVNVNNINHYKNTIAKVLSFNGIGSKYLLARLLIKQTTENLPPVGSLAIGRRGGLIGKITEITEVNNVYTVKVQLVSNSKFAIAVKQSGVKDTFIIKGDGKNSAFIAYRFQSNEANFSTDTDNDRDDIENTNNKTSDQNTDKNMYLFTATLNVINVPEVLVGKLVRNANRNIDEYKIQIFENLYDLDYISIVSPNSGNVVKVE